MENYLVDRETLGQFVDELFKQKPLPVNSPEELNNLREENIKALDERIGAEIFNSLTDEQNQELSQLLDQNSDESTYQTFFARAGINLEEKITDAMRGFTIDYLGGKNGQ